MAGIFVNNLTTPETQADVTKWELEEARIYPKTGVCINIYARKTTAGVCVERKETRHSMSAANMTTLGTLVVDSDVNSTEDSSAPAGTTAEE